MATSDVRIEELKPMRVASVRVTSVNPEIDAWRELKAWAEPRGLLRDPESHPVFGYTCQPPAGDGQPYGFEFWIAVDAGTEVSGNVKELAFPGGVYAVITHDGPPSPEVWRRLWDWVQASPYSWRRSHELERPTSPLAPEQEWTFDLYLPIEAA